MLGVPLVEMLDAPSKLELAATLLTAVGVACRAFQVAHSQRLDPFANLLALFVGRFVLSGDFTLGTPQELQEVLEHCAESTRSSGSVSATTPDHLRSPTVR